MTQSFAVSWTLVLPFVVGLGLGLVAAPAHAEEEPHPLIAALHALRQETTADEALQTIVKRASKPDAAAIERLRQAMRKRDKLAIVDACAELDHRWLKVVVDLPARMEAIVMLEGFAESAARLGSPKKAWHEEAVVLTQKVAQQNPDNAKVHELLGELLGMPPARPLPALEAFARCLDLEPRNDRCRKPFDELARWYVTPQCAGNDLRAVQLRALAPDAKGIELPASAIEAGAAGSAFAKGICRGSALKVNAAAFERVRTAFAKSKSPPDMSVSIEGHERVRIRLDGQPGAALVCVPIPVDEVCVRTSKPTLPPSVARWLHPGPKE